ncbi:MAG: nucleotidyl transferase AbiEii/AbiGii toxin family protein [Deltaproteobacteria bacterium]|nr:nucleotidyl transferase AbiEii/AbiGii toxin family protein [Deltaproteobacteria bacterium]
MRKPRTAEGYSLELAVEARRMCLYIATILGDLLDEVVVVGGLVPYLIIDQDTDTTERHVGTRDLDLGLSLAVLDEELYKDISARLRDRDFRHGLNEEGNPTRQTWVLPDQRISVDFLIPRSDRGPAAGRLQNLESDFAAIVTPALPLAFRDFVVVPIEDRTPREELARRDVRVCGPAAFVVMKAHALRLRGENKDAYDLVYTLQSYGDGTVREVADRFAAIANTLEARDALTFLAEDFASPEHLGPKRAAEFRTGGSDARVQADAFGYVSARGRSSGMIATVRRRAPYSPHTLHNPSGNGSSSPNHTRIGRSPSYRSVRTVPQ